MNNWITDVFSTEKPIIAMCHMRAMPGDPQYDHSRGLDWVYDMARSDMLALQKGGVDAIMFSNEFSLPYLTTVQPITTACMASLVSALKQDLTVPFGINVLWDPRSSIDVAMATGAQFVREIFTGVYASDFGLWNTSAGEVIRHQHAIHADHIKLLFNIVPEAAAYLGNRNITDIARSTVFNHNPDGLCVSGLTAGVETSTETLQLVKQAVPDTPVFVNTGVNADNVIEQLAAANGAIVGTFFKRDRYIWNEVDPDRVRKLMKIVKSFRNSSV